MRIIIGEKKLSDKENRQYLPATQGKAGEKKPTKVPQPPKYRMYSSDGSFNEEKFFELIGNDIRRRILSKLAKFPRYASDLAIDLNVSKQAVKKHLDKLVEFGLVDEAPVMGEDQKKQFYKICDDVAIFSKIDLTPNYFSMNARNYPEDFNKEIASIEHNPSTALASAFNIYQEYDQLNSSLNILGKMLHDNQKQMEEMEKERKKVLLQKTVLLNRIQMIINGLIEDDLEKEVLFSLFFDVKSSTEGWTLENILDQLFLRKKKRAGVKKGQIVKTDARMIQRGEELLKLLQLLVNNFGFIRTTDAGMKLVVDFGSID
jgi:predicted transcriptional regulator